VLARYSQVFVAVLLHAVERELTFVRPLAISLRASPILPVPFAEIFLKPEPTY